MIEPTKHQSNPFSTGGGGGNFETRVQAAFTVIMLSGRVAPCQPSFKITNIKLQGRYAGFHTDDFIVYSQHPHSGQQAKLLAQIKHDISKTENDEIFAEVINAAWNDFIGDNFNAGVDAIALITEPLSSSDINNVRPILEWARHSENEDEFIAKVNAPNFSSKAKRKKLEAFKIQLKKANNNRYYRKLDRVPRHCYVLKWFPINFNTDISDFQLWNFLKIFHLIGYDLDVQTGSTYSLLHSLISLYSNEAPTYYGHGLLISFR